MIYWFIIGLFIFGSVVIPLSKENERLKKEVKQLKEEIEKLK